jgi:Holliday junction resolvasome RuvABC ATP-dependent DNA helicase subunit
MHPLINSRSTHYKKIKVTNELINTLRDLSIFSEMDLYNINLLLGQEVEAIDIIQLGLSKEELIGACKFNILKYSLRDKNQDELDLSKIEDYKVFLSWIIS